MMDHRNTGCSGGSANPLNQSGEQPDDGLSALSILMMKVPKKRGVKEHGDLERLSKGEKRKSKSSADSDPCSEEKPTKQRFRDVCRVCSDAASGLHYGVPSCEGCKGFFKRSVQMGRSYNCRFFNNCSVNKKTRNSCQACRFQKCISAGMYTDLVRPDRTPGNRRKRPIPVGRDKPTVDCSVNVGVSSISNDVGTTLPSPSTSTSVSMGEPMSSDSPLMPPSDGSQTVPMADDTVSISSQSSSSSSTTSSNDSRASRTAISFDMGTEGLEAKTNSSSNTSQDLDSPETLHSTPDAPETGLQSLCPPSVSLHCEPLPHDLLMSRLPPDLHELVTNMINACPNWIPTLNHQGLITCQNFMNVAYAELEYIVWFARRQQGFNSLSMNDRRRLLRNSFLAMQLVRLSFRSVGCESRKILFAIGMEYTPEEALKVSQFPSVVINMNLELIDWFQSLKMDEVECGILQTIILTSDDADNLMDRPFVRRIQNTHLEALREYSCIRFPHTPYRFASLLLRLPFVRKMALVCMDNFLLMIESGQLTMDQLTSELVTTSQDKGEQAC